MSPEGLEVSATRVRSSAAELRAIADRFSQAAKSFEAEVAGFGEPWGGDDIGALIGLAHGAVFQAAMECFTSNAEELTGRAEELRQAADNHEQTEEANTLYVNRISEIL